VTLFGEAGVGDPNRAPVTGVTADHAEGDAVVGAVDVLDAEGWSLGERRVRVGDGDDFPVVVHIFVGRDAVLCVSIVLFVFLIRDAGDCVLTIFRDAPPVAAAARRDFATASGGGPRAFSG
jgi:hypothetical protein